jgi:anti-sigma-K factor RskA
MTNHATIEQLGDYADGMLAPGDAAGVERHVSACVSCARDLARLRALLSETAALPREVAPPDALWPSIRSSLEARKVAALPVHRAPTRRGWSLASRRAAAAAILVVVAGAVGVAIRGRTPDAPAPRAVTAYTVSSRTSAVLATMIDRHYMPALDQLSASLQRARAGAPRATLVAVDHGLEIVDSAIAETRAALARDPGNREIADLLVANYQRKVDLLKRASELTGEQ